MNESIIEEEGGKAKIDLLYLGNEKRYRERRKRAEEVG